MKYILLAIAICIATTIVTAQKTVSFKDSSCLIKMSESHIIGVLSPMHKDTLIITYTDEIKFIKFGDRLYQVITTAPTLKELVQEFRYSPSHLIDSISSYKTQKLFVPSIRDSVPCTLFGYPAGQGIDIINSNDRVFLLKSKIEIDSMHKIWDGGWNSKLYPLLSYPLGTFRECIPDSIRINPYDYKNTMQL